MEQINTDHELTEEWQQIVDIMAELLHVPAGLIMRVNGPDIEVFVSSQTPENPYHPGDKEHLIGSGLYCETVIKTRERLHVPNALSDPLWDHNPDIKLGMVSYLGFPIVLPSGNVFGTICVLDNKENHYTPVYEQLVYRFKKLIEGQLLLADQNQRLMAINQELEKRMAEIHTLRGILPICSYCKKIRDDDGYWQALDVYVQAHSEAEFSHGICLDCMAEHFPQSHRKLVAAGNI